MFVLSIPVVIVELDFLSDVLGFVAFLLIFTYVLRQVFSEREILKSDSA